MMNSATNTIAAITICAGWTFARSWDDLRRMPTAPERTILMTSITTFPRAPRLRRGGAAAGAGSRPAGPPPRPPAAPGDAEEGGRRRDVAAPRGRRRVDHEGDRHAPRLAGGER